MQCVDTLMKALPTVAHMSHVHAVHLPLFVTTAIVMVVAIAIAITIVTVPIVVSIHTIAFAIVMRMYCSRCAFFPN